jgi:uncharacterized protein YeaO (DUF488 family)
MKPLIKIKRAYDPPSEQDGYRVLVDRLWPRGIAKTDAAVKEWNKDLAPSPELRKWFGHDPARWLEFRKKYLTELKKNEAIGSFVEAHESTRVLTLVYGAKDEQHNHALVLQEYLMHVYQEE